MVPASDQLSIRSIAVVGACLPRRDGVAVFTSELCQALDGQAWAVAVNDESQVCQYGPLIRFEIQSNVPQGYRRAAEFLNMHEAGGAILQHAFGLYGGPAGCYVLRLLRELHMPVVATLHDLPEHPTRDQHAVIAQMARLSDRLVVMSHRGRDLLERAYDVEPRKIACIPHGIPDLPFLDPQARKADVGLAGRKVILTFGLLAPGKGVESMVRAMPAVLRRHPEAVYVVLGATHPAVRVERGEEYRQRLYHLVRQMGLEDHVAFRGHFAGPEELGWYLAAADLCVTPYLDPDVLTSGVLAYAMGAGNAVVSTPFWLAREMLAQDRGVLVPFGDDDRLAEEVSALLGDGPRREAVRRKAYQYTRPMVWPAVALRYVGLLQEALLDRERPARRTVALADPLSWSEIVPELDLRHLRVMTDGTGLIQHAVYAIPDRRYGYCTDDNARALIVAMRHWDLRREPRVRPLISTYLAFLVHAFHEQRRRFRNFMSYSREWLEEVGSEDSHGRALLACGVTANLAPHDSTVGLAVRLFRDALPVVEDFTSPRSLAFTLVGLDAYLRRFEDDAAAHRMLEVLAGRLLTQFRRNSRPDWPWLEDELTWGNARVPHGLLLAAARLGSAEMREVALHCLRWQLEIQTADAGHLTIIGNQGWYPRGGRRAVFDQQPIEAMNLAEACRAAYILTRDRAWLVEVRRCLEWFLGRNDLGIPVYDFSTGGCRDGLSAGGVNANQGAESTLAWLITLLAVHRLQVMEMLNFPDLPRGSIESQNRII